MWGLRFVVLGPKPWKNVPFSLVHEDAMKSSSFALKSCLHPHPFYLVRSLHLDLYGPHDRVLLMPGPRHHAGVSG